MARRSRRDYEEARRLIYEMDPVLWYLTKGCAQTVRDTLSKNPRFLLLEGGQRTSKTTTGMACTAAFLRGIHPWRPWFGAVRGVVVLPTRQQAVTEWGPRLVGSYDGLFPAETAGSRLYKPDDPDMARRPWIPANEIRKIYKSRSVSGLSPARIVLANGSELFIVLGDDADSWTAVESTSFDFIARDEGIGDRTLGASLTMRLGDAIQLDLDGQRPNAGWQIWTATEFEPNAELADERRRCMDPDQPDHVRVKLTPEDNPACRAEARKILGNAMSKREAAKRVTGERHASADYRVYGEQFSEDRHLLKAPFHIEPDHNILLAMDPGVHVKHPFGIGAFAMTPARPHTLFGVAYFAAVGTHGKDLLKEVHEWLAGHPVSYVAYDPAANQTDKAVNKPLSDCFVEWFEELGILVTGDYLAGHNRHKSTIQQVREWLDPTPWDKTCEPRLMFDPFGPGMMEAMDEFVSYAFNPKTHDVVKLEDTYPDVVRYLVSVDPVYERPLVLHHRRAKDPVQRVMHGDNTDLTPEQVEYYKNIADIVQFQDEDEAEEYVDDFYGGVFGRIR